MASDIFQELSLKLVKLSITQVNSYMTDDFDGSMTLRSPGQESIRQFVIYAENKVGWLNDFISMLKEVDIHILLSQFWIPLTLLLLELFQTIPKDLARLLKSQSISFTERNVLAVEVENENSIQKVTQSLLGAEINIHYVYSFMHQPNGRPVLAIAMEDQDTAEEALKSYNLSVLSQEDFLR